MNFLLEEPLSVGGGLASPDTEPSEEQGWHILRIIFKKSSPADKIGLNWRKLDKSGEKWIKLNKTIIKGYKGQVF